MNEALIIILAFLWALVLLPGAIRARRSSTHATVGGFNRAMEVLRQPPDGRQLMVPGDADRIVSAPAGAPTPGGGRAGGTPRRSVDREVLEQRRRVFFAGLGTVGVLLPLAVFVGGFFWTLFLVVAAGLGGYTALLRRWKLQRDEAREIVRDLSAARPRSAADQSNGHRPERVAVGSTWSTARQPDERREDGSSVRIRAWSD